MTDERRRVAVVLGAGGGIGRACVDDLARRGFAVVAVGRSAAGSRGDAGSSEDDAAGFSLDLATAQDGEELLQFALSTFGRLDALVNAAAVYLPSPSTALTHASWDETMGPNLRGALLVTSSVARHLAGQGRGRIVQITSITASVSRGGYGLYEASKAGLVAASRSMAVELAPRGVTVNCVAPGWVRTPMIDGLVQADQRQVAELIPVGRVGEPAELAAVVGWLVAESPAYLTGQTITVDGGQTAHTSSL
ncbi:MAG: SDR family NAD(P)-dependent oxidoreductase [Actinomycetes bacterium]